MKIPKAQASLFLISNQLMQTFSSISGNCSSKESIMMNEKIQEPEPNLHGLGVGYVYGQLSREGHTIFEVNTDPDVAFQILAKKDDKFVAVAIRTAQYPDRGSINRAECEQLIQESEQLDSVPCFVGLTARSLNASDKMAGVNGGEEYQMSSNGITIVEEC